MDAKGQTPSTVQSASWNGRRLAGQFLLILCGWLGVYTPCWANFEESFESEQTSFRPMVVGIRSRIVSHSREAGAAHSGKRGEVFRAEILEDGSTIRAEMPVPKGRALEGVTAEVFIRANRPGAVLAIKISCSSANHPETGEPLQVVITGEPYSTAGNWQKLTCGLTEKNLAEKIRPLRAKYRQAILMSDLVVESVMIAAPADRGLVEIALDDLRVNPLLSIDNSISTAAQAMEVEQISHVEFRLDRLVVDGKPLLPRFVPWHGESPEGLRKMGLNLVWAPDWSDTAALKELREAGLWATATPPKPKSTTGENLLADEAGLPPFLPGTSPILFWNLGTRVSGRASEDLLNWVEQVQAADRGIRRPLAADVIGAERLYSRHIDMLGMSRHVIHSSTTFLEYRRWLAIEKSRGRPGTFSWTWLQTEPSPNWKKFTTTVDSPKHAATETDINQASVTRGQSEATVPFVHHVEPEQLRLQAWIALTSGYRGLGFWSTSPLDEAGPLAQERRAALAMLNLELELLEPWLATSSPFAETTFTIEQPRGSDGKSADAKGRSKQTSESESQELTATVLRTELGTLVIPMWLESKSQYVPGKLAGNTATIVVPGANEAALAYEISPTGIDGRKHRRVAGGLEITLPKFDQMTVILLTSDRQLVAQLEQRAAAIQAVYAQACLDLTRLKLERVRQVDNELQQLKVGQADSHQILGSARIYFEQAEYAFRNEDYRGAHNACLVALQGARILQRAHWEEAVRKSTSPLGSPYTVCFQTLPLHWKMIARMGRANLQGDNLLASGDFEAPDQLISDGWNHLQHDVPGWLALAELFPGGQNSRYALRLAAFEQQKDPKGKEASIEQQVDGEPLLTIKSPAIEFTKDDIVYLSGSIRMPKPIVGPADGLTITDSLSGRAGLHRFAPSNEWQRFEIIRPCSEAGSIQWVIELGGAGEVLVDNLQIRKLTTTQTASGHSTPDGTGGSKLRGLLPRWPQRSKPGATPPTSP